MGIVEVAEITGLGLVVAANPLPVIGQFALVTRQNGLRVAIGLAIGWAGSLVILTSLFAIGLAAVADIVVSDEIGQRAKESTIPPPETDSESWIPIVIGAILFTLGVVAWFRKPRDPKAPPSRLIRAFSTLGASRAVLLGAGLAPLNPKSIVAILGAAAVINYQGSSIVMSVALILLFTAAGSLAIAIPAILATVGGDRTSEMLNVVQSKIVGNSGRTSAGLLIVVGILMLALGLIQLIR